MDRNLKTYEKGEFDLTIKRPYMETIVTWSGNLSNNIESFQLLKVEVALAIWSCNVATKTKISLEICNFQIYSKIKIQKYE